MGFEQSRVHVFFGCRPEDALRFQRREHSFGHVCQLNARTFLLARLVPQQWQSLNRFLYFELSDFLFLQDVACEISCHCAHAFLCNDAKLARVETRYTRLSFAILVVRLRRDGNSVITLQIGVGSAHRSQDCRRATEPCAAPPAHYSTQHISASCGFQIQLGSHTTTNYAASKFVHADVAIFCSNYCFRKPALATVGLFLPLTLLIAILHWLPLSISIFCMPMVLYSTEDKLHIGFDFALKLPSFFKTLAHEMFVLHISPQESIDIRMKEKPRAHRQVSISRGTCIIHMEFLLQFLDVAL